MMEGLKPYAQYKYLGLKRHMLNLRKSAQSVDDYSVVDYSEVDMGSYPQITQIHADSQKSPAMIVELKRHAQYKYLGSSRLMLNLRKSAQSVDDYSEEDMESYPQITQIHADSQKGARL